MARSTTAALSPSKLVNSAGRGRRALTPARLDMVSQREHNQHMVFVVFPHLVSCVMLL